MSRALALDSALALPGSAAATVAWRAKGTLYVTVIVKATFAFASDAHMRLAKPQPVLWAEVHHGNNPGRSILYTTDLAPALARADVLFTGSAHAVPAGQTEKRAPVRSLPVRLALFSGGRPTLDKRLLVQDPEGLTHLPLVYERTAIGPNAGNNPFGLTSTEGVASVVDPARPGHPAGFGPIGSSWPSRKHLLGKVPRQTLNLPIAEIPDGFAWGYFQAAPPDQQVDLLRGDEWILLEGLHPTQPFFRTRLPEARGAARIHGLAAFGVPEGQGLDLVADTLRIEGDEQQCTVVWRGSFPVASEEALPAVRVVAGVSVGGEPLPWVDPVRAAARAPAAVPHHTHPATGGETLALSPEVHKEASRRPALGFQPGAAPMETRWGTVRLEVERGPAPSTGTLSFGPSEAPIARKDVLPFHEGVASGHEVLDESTSALDPDLAFASVLPFQAGAADISAPGPRPTPASTGTLALLGDPAPRGGALPFTEPTRGPEHAPPVDAEDGLDMATIRIRVRDLEPPVPPAPPRDVATPSPEKEPWAPAPPPALPSPAPPAPPAPAPTPPAASDSWKQGLYGRFGNKR